MSFQEALAVAQKSCTVMYCVVTTSLLVLQITNIDTMFNTRIFSVNMFDTMV